MHKKLNSFLALLCLLGVTPAAYGTVIVEGAKSNWEQTLAQPSSLPEIPSRIIVQYATSIFNGDMDYPAGLIAATDNLPDRVVVEYATSIAIKNLVPIDIIYLDVVFPASQEVLIKGQKYTIAWSSANVAGPIQIDLYMDGSNVLQLAAAANNTGTYDFFIPDFLNGGTTYRIGISAENGQVWNFSPVDFVITPYRCTVQSDISDASLTMGDAITYRICLENTEEDNLTGLQIINPIPIGTVFGGATGVFNYIDAEKKVIWTISDLPPDAASCVELTVNIAASPGAVVSNSVTVNSGAFVATMKPYKTTVTGDSVLAASVPTAIIGGLPVPHVPSRFGQLVLHGTNVFYSQYPTYVISHGWKPSYLPPFGDYSLPGWQIEMADKLRMLPANVFTWNWLYEAEAALPPYLKVNDSGFNLFDQLQRKILSYSSQYEGDIHLIGFSLGSAVVVNAAKYLRNSGSVLFDNVKNITLLDSPYPLFVPGESFLADTKGQIFVDNYYSFFGRPRFAEADVNVELIGMDLLCWETFNDPHGFSHLWFSSSIDNFQTPPLLCDSNAPSEQMEYGFYWSNHRNVTDALYYHAGKTPNWQLQWIPDPINFINGAIQDGANWIQGQYVDAQGFVVDKKEELNSLAEKTKNKIKILSANTFADAASATEAVTDVMGHSSWLQYTVKNIAYDVMQLRCQSDASLSVRIDIPMEANALRFSFELPLADRGTVLELFINETLAYLVRGDDYVQRGWQHSEWIDVTSYAGQDVDLAFRMSNAASGSKGVVHLDDIIVARIIQAIDTDKDTVLDAEDNCPNDPNSDQADEDMDGIGDLCDVCPTVANADQMDQDCDCDVDGADLASIISAPDINKIQTIAAALGRVGCH